MTSESAENVITCKRFALNCMYFSSALIEQALKMLLKQWLGYSY